MLTDDVFNRTDDHLPPIDLPERTSKVALLTYLWARERA
jgi:hypothetical protein